MGKTKNFSKIGIGLLLLAITLTGLIVGGKPLHAAPLGGQGLEISPPFIELSVNPGQSVTFDIHLRNITKDTLVTKASVDDFVAAGEDGRPRLLLGEDTEPSPFSFKTWIKALPDMTLLSQEAKVTKVTLDVPQDASPGGHYGVVRFSALPPELEGSGVSLSASLGALVLVNVSGNVNTKASMEEFFVTQNGKKQGWFESGPVSFVERIKNEGNVHFKPIGTVRVTDTFGNEVKVLSVNEKGGNVLPGSIRRFEQELNQESLFGFYRAEANLQYGGKSLHSNLSFWIIPYKSLTIGLGVLILAIILSITGLKRYNRYIIAKAGAQKASKK